MNKHALKKLRAALNLTQQEFADALGLHRAYYNLMESGKRNVSKANTIIIKDTMAKMKKTELLDKILLEEAQKTAADFENEKKDFEELGYDPRNLSLNNEQRDVLLITAAQQIFSVLGLSMRNTAILEKRPLAEIVEETESEGHERLRNMQDALRLMVKLKK